MVTKEEWNKMLNEIYEMIDFFDEGISLTPDESDFLNELLEMVKDVVDGYGNWSELQEFLAKRKDKSE